MSQPAEEPQSILVVDDLPDNLGLLTQILHDSGYRVRVALTGQDALAAIVTELPDLILLDVLLPDMDGYGICERLKKHRRTADVPVLFISALEATDFKIRAFAAGASDYITKPFRAREVLARVETHLALRTTQRRLQAANAQLAEKVAALDALNASLQTRNAELDAFAHTVAHDLKNPVSQVMGFADFLACYHESLEPDKLREALQTIVRASAKMNSIIEELLLLSQLRKVDVIAEPLYMPRIVEEALGRVAAFREELGGQVLLPDFSTWPAVLGHRAWIEEVWVNYVSNALKYGGRPPCVELGAEPCGNGMVRFWVHDNGPGMSRDEQARLFAPFERIDQVRATGYGLGLSIVRRIVEKLHGEVGVQSEDQDGATFFFTLPAAGPGSS